MPRRQKSKLRAREKSHQGQGAGQGVGGAEAAAAAAATAAEAPPHSTMATARVTPQGSPQADAAQQPRGTPVPGSPGSLGAGAAGSPRKQGVKGPAAPPAPGARRDLLTPKANLLLQFLLEKRTRKEPITRPSPLKVVSRKYQGQLRDILGLTSKRLELLFGQELREDTPGQSFLQVSKPGLPGKGGAKGPFTTGLLLVLLGLILWKRRRASKEQVREFLNALGVYLGHRYRVFQEPQKLLTQELVRQKSLESRHVPGSLPLRQEFPWGLLSLANISKMQALAKLSHKAPSCFPQLYQEALRDEAKRRGATGPARVASAGEAAGPSGAGPGSPLRPKSSESGGMAVPRRGGTGPLTFQVVPSPRGWRE